MENDSQFYLVWIGLGPIVVKIAMDRIRRLAWWAKSSRFSHRLAPVVLSAVWAGIYVGVSAIQSGASWLTAILVFGASTLSIVAREGQKLIAARTSPKEGAKP